MKQSESNEAAVPSALFRNYVNTGLRTVFHDGVFALLVFAVAFTAAAAYLNGQAIRSPYMLHKYGASVMVGLGQGFASPNEAKAPLIRQFLRQHQAPLQAEKLPGTIPAVPPNQFERNHYYAQYLLGLFWRFFGFYWSVLDAILALFFAITCACAYGVLRLGMGRPIALLGALLFTASPAMFYVLPQYRDFSKAPFLVASLLLLGVAIKRELRWPTLIALALALGLVVGAGTGFRRDLASAVPAALVVLLCFQPGRLRGTLLKRLLAAALFLGAFYGAARPLLTASREGTNSAHSIALGLTRPHDERLGLGGAPYTLGHIYRDAYMHAHISTHALFHGNFEKSPPYGSAEYDAAGTHYLTTVAAHFPADLMLRWYRAAGLLLSEAPFALDNLDRSFYPIPPLVLQLLRWRAYLLGGLIGWGTLLAALALLLMAMVNLRTALATAFLTFYFGGYTMLQFHVRHYFVYELFFFFATGFVIQALVLDLPRFARLQWRSYMLGQGNSARLWRWPAFQRAGIFLTVALVAVEAPLGAARLYQAARVERLYSQYAQAPRQQLKVQPREGQWVHFAIPDYLPLAEATEVHKKFRVQPGVVAVALDAARQGFPIRFEYSAESKVNDFTTTVQFEPQISLEPHWVFFPVVNTTDNYFGAGPRRFSGVSVPKPYASHVKGVFALTHPERLDLLLTLAIPERFKHAGRAVLPLNGVTLNYARASWALRRNLLANGGFEDWPEDAPAPSGYAKPEGALLQPETRRATYDSLAVRETWSNKFDPRSPRQWFRLETDELDQNVVYDLYVSAINLASGDAQVNAYAKVAPVQGTIRLEPLAPMPLTFSQSAVPREGHLRFGPLPEKTIATVITMAPPAGASSGTVIWDGLRIIPAPCPVRAWPLLPELLCPL